MPADQISSDNQNLQAKEVIAYAVKEAQSPQALRPIIMSKKSSIQQPEIQ